MLRTLLIGLVVVIAIALGSVYVAGRGPPRDSRAICHHCYLSDVRETLLLSPITRESGWRC